MAITEDRPLALEAGEALDVVEGVEDEDRPAEGVLAPEPGRPDQREGLRPLVAPDHVVLLADHQVVAVGGADVDGELAGLVGHLSLDQVDAVEIGYRQITMKGVSFPSKDGFSIKIDISVVYGLQPKDVPVIINRLGNINEVVDKVIHPQVESICRIEGSKYGAKELIEGETGDIEIWMNGDRNAFNSDWNFFMSRPHCVAIYRFPGK